MLIDGPWPVPPFDLTQFFVFTLVLVRTSALLMVVPVFGRRSVPSQVRVFLSLALALLITPAQLAHCVIPPR